MKKVKIVAGVVLLALTFLAGVVHGAASRTYQVTGPVLDVTADMIVVQKGEDRWELARDGSTKVTGDLKKGGKVTIDYRMTATKITVAK